MDLSRPAGDEGHPGSAFIGRALVAAKDAVVGVSVVGLLVAAVDVVGGAVGVEDAPVIARHNHQGIIRKLEAIEGVEDAAKRPVERVNSVSADAGVTGAAEARIRDSRHMDVMRGEIQEERFRFIILNELDALFGQHVGDQVVFPKRGFASELLADAWDAADEGAGFAALDAVIELDRIGGIKVHDPMILHPDAGGAVARGRDDPRVVEAYFQRAGFDFRIIVCRGLA